MNANDLRDKTVDELRDVLANMKKRASISVFNKLPVSWKTLQASKRHAAMLLV